MGHCLLLRDFGSLPCCPLGWLTRLCPRKTFTLRVLCLTGCGSLHRLPSVFSRVWPSGRNDGGKRQGTLTIRIRPESDGSWARTPRQKKESIDDDQQSKRASYGIPVSGEGSNARPLRLRAGSSAWSHAWDLVSAGIQSNSLRPCHRPAWRRHSQSVDRGHVRRHWPQTEDRQQPRWPVERKVLEPRRLPGDDFRSGFQNRGAE